MMSSLLLAAVFRGGGGGAVAEVLVGSPFTLQTGHIWELE